MPRHDALRAGSQSVRSFSVLLHLPSMGSPFGEGFPSRRAAILRSQVQLVPPSRDAARRTPTLDAQGTFPPELFRHAVESAYDAILITSPELEEPGPRIEWVNDAFVAMTGWAREEVVGQSPRVLQGPKTSRDLLDQLRENLVHDRPFRGESVNYRKDGTEYVVEWNISALRDEAGAVTHWVAVQRDTTDWHRTAEELEARVQERTRELEGFLYTVSHDFRAPLRAIMSASMILIEDYGDQIGKDGQNELRRQSAAAKKLGNLMDDLLRLSRLARQDVRAETLDLTALAREVASEVASRASSEKPRIAVQDGLQGEVDPSLARLLFQNLLENAVKFAKPGGARVEVGQSEGAIFVRDEGIGFPPDKADKIFGPFERLHTDAEYPGTGVGLANVKRIVDRHGGRVWADGRPGEGATFWVKLGR